MRRTLLAALVAVALLAGSSFESARAQGLAAPAAGTGVPPRLVPPGANAIESEFGESPGASAYAAPAAVSNATTVVGLRAKPPGEIVMPRSAGAPI